MPTLSDALEVTAVACAHCDLPVAAGDVEPGAERQFCCSGCRTAWGILHEHGLDTYYRLPERRQSAVGSSSRTYEEFDHPAFHELNVRGVTGGLSRTRFVLEGIHCASCVWLVERVPLILPGVARAELDVRQSLVTIEWDAAATRLSAVAQTLASLGYPPHPHHGGAREEIRKKEDRAALVRIGVAGAIAINVMLAALAMYSGWFGSGLEQEFERFFRWISFALAIPAIVWPGQVFFRGAWAALRTRTLHLDLPIAIALGAGFVRGAINTITDRGPIYFDGVSVLIFLLLIGRYLQSRWQRAATDASELLYSLTPNGCRIAEPDGTTQEIPASALVPGMLLDVRAGDTLAADGVVETGESSLSLSWLTGESRPVAVHPGADVFAGTVNLGAPLRVRVTSSGESTRVARVLRQVEESSARRAPVVLLANRMAGVFVAVVLVLAIITWSIWVGRDASAATDHAIALLIVTCPCALAMATPLSVTVALGRAARRGIFVKGGDALQLLSGHGQLLLDKTGTVTEGRSALIHWDGPDRVKPLVLALEAGSVHPIAEGFRNAWPDLSPAHVESSVHTIGGGIRAHADGHDVVVGSPRFVSSLLNADTVTANLPDHLTPVWIAVDGAVVARAGFGDPVRNGADVAIRALRERSWNVGMLSGDALSVCRAVAEQVGIPSADVHAEATPEGKRDVVAAARQSTPVVMVGDGVNDAAAMATASVGIAVHGGAEAALATSDVYLTRPGLDGVVELIDGSRRTMTIVKRNIAFSLAYNVLGVALAMTGTINPIIAAIMMPLSSLTVVAGAWYGHSFSRSGVALPTGRR